MSSICLTESFRTAQNSCATQSPPRIHVEVNDVDMEWLSRGPTWGTDADGCHEPGQAFFEDNSESCNGYTFRSRTRADGEQFNFIKMCCDVIICSKEGIHNRR